MAKQARVISGMATDVTTGDPAELFHPDVAAEFEPVPTTVVEGSRLVDGVWLPPDHPVEPEPIAVTDYYLAKVTFERRFTDAQFAPLDALVVTVRNRPADWATTEDPAWVARRPHVRPVLNYDATGNVNVLDPEVRPLLEALQAQLGLFGENPDEAADEIDRILAPTRYEGEPPPPVI